MTVGFQISHLRLNRDIFCVLFQKKQSRRASRKARKPTIFCYNFSYGLIEMLFPHWPYRVPNQELTIINSIFYNRMQRWVSSSIFCRYRSTIRNFDCYLSSLFQQKVISVRIWRIIYLPIASQWCIEVLQPSFYMVQYRHDGLGGCGFETDSRRRAKISTKKWANNFRASFF